MGDGSAKLTARVAEASQLPNLEEWPALEPLASAAADVALVRGLR
jgi:hypothetical protein